MKLRLVMVFGALALTVGSPAEAKGISGVSITGAGLARPIVLDTRVNPSALGRFLDAAPPLVGAASRADLGPADLGPRLRLTWTIAWKTTQQVIRDVYPYAPRGPVFYTPGGQVVFDQRTESEWHQAGPEALAALQSVGLPRADELRSAQAPLGLDGVPAVEGRAILRW